MERDFNHETKLELEPYLQSLGMVVLTFNSIRLPMNNPVIWSSGFGVRIIKYSTQNFIYFLE